MDNRGPRAIELIARLRDSGMTIAVAESLTGGQLAATLIDVPGASDVVRGAVVAYATDLKKSLLGVDSELLENLGAVDPNVALQMAKGVRALLDSDVGLATTGVAGPTEQDGRPVGTVYLAAISPYGNSVEEHHYGGDRAAIRGQSVESALRMVEKIMRADGARKFTNSLDLSE